MMMSSPHGRLTLLRETDLSHDFEFLCLYNTYCVRGDIQANRNRTVDSVLNGGE